jgi:hypothetical protein
MGKNSFQFHFGPFQIKKKKCAWKDRKIDLPSGDCYQVYFLVFSRAMILHTKKNWNLKKISILNESTVVAL